MIHKEKTLNVSRPLVAALRDNNFYRSHGLARRVHIVTDEGFSACGRVAVMYDDPEGAAMDIDPSMRCKHPGCQKYFHEADKQPNTEAKPTREAGSA